MTKAEIEEAQKITWLEEHLPYELKMCRYSFLTMKEAHPFYLDWNMALASFAVAAGNLSAFLTNSDGSGNIKASDYVESFKSRKGDLSGVFARMEPLIFHLGKARPTDEGKFSLRDAEKIADWIEKEMAVFVSRLGSYEKYWNGSLAMPEARPPQTMFLHGPTPQSSSAYSSSLSSGQGVTGARDPVQYNVKLPDDLSS